MIALFPTHDISTQFHKSPVTHISGIRQRKAKQYQEQNPIQVRSNHVRVGYAATITNRCIVSCNGNGISSTKPIRFQDLGA